MGTPLISLQGEDQMGALVDFARIAIPRGAKRFLREAHRRFAFWQAMRRTERVSLHDLPTSAAKDLVYGWGNEAMSAREEFLEALYHHAWLTSGPILECGAGLSTHLLGLVAQQTGKAV